MAPKKKTHPVYKGHVIRRLASEKMSKYNMLTESKRSLLFTPV